MDTKSFLDELLKTGRELAEKGQSVAEEQLNIAKEGNQRDAALDGMKKGALAAGALAILLGTRPGRKLTGTALKLGSVAAIGTIAWKAMQNWQNQQAGSSKITLDEPKALPVDKLEGERADERSLVLIKAMIAAAKIDGNLDDDEKAKINAQIRKLGLGEDISDVFQAGMVTPLSANSVAKMADNLEVAAEIYLVSMLVTDEQNTQEKLYMDSLAKALELPDEVVAELKAYRHA